MTFPPAGIGCRHQQQARSQLQTGLINEVEAEKVANGGSCSCPDKVRPSGFILPNKGDKGAYKHRYLFLSLHQKQMMDKFLRIRNEFFKNNLPEKEIMGRTPLFLNSAGNKFDKVTFTIFNKAVGLEGKPAKFTPYILRRFYTTWLNNHDNAFVKAMRGEVTGNTQRIFERHYNTDRAGQFGNVFGTILHHFRPEVMEDIDEDEDDDTSDLRQIQLQQLREANEDAKDTEETMDMVGT